MQGRKTLWMSVKCKKHRTKLLVRCINDFVKNMDCRWSDAIEAHLSMKHAWSNNFIHISQLFEMLQICYQEMWPLRSQHLTLWQMNTWFFCRDVSSCLTLSHKDSSLICSCYARFIMVPFIQPQITNQLAFFSFLFKWCMQHKLHQNGFLCHIRKKYPTNQILKENILPTLLVTLSPAWLTLHLRLSVLGCRCFW